MRKNFCKNRCLLFGSAVFQLLLDESATMLVSAGIKNTPELAYKPLFLGIDFKTGYGLNQ